MPVLDFKCKSTVYAHHLGVPYRALQLEASKSLTQGDKKPDWDNNLIVQGDNLHALKALMPQYASRIKCIYIDPPYNTGKEGWRYNDNVNSPMIREWFDKEVDTDDLERHDKWCCMMWPRLQLLRELLSEDGSIFVSIDNNEHHHLRSLMDEVFGEDNFMADISWNGMDTIKNDAKHFSTNHEFILAYAKNKEEVQIQGFDRTEEQKKVYKNKDQDPRGPYLLTPLHAKSGTDQSLYEFKFPNGQVWQAPQGRYPRFSKNKLSELVKAGEIWLDPKGEKVPQKKTYLSQVSPYIRPHTFWSCDDFGSTRQSNIELSEILGKGQFENPKGTRLIKKILQVANVQKDDIVLDSFAGSGTTAHAVLDLNRQDGGNRKFILVQCDEYNKENKKTTNIAHNITAERVRRVIKGVPAAKNEALKQGLGGSFTYCTLGSEMNVENLLKGKSLPSPEVLSKYIFYTATGHTLEDFNENDDFYVAQANSVAYFIIYKADLKFLRSLKSALNLDKVEGIKKLMQQKKCTQAMVFASACYYDPKDLRAEGIIFCQLPFAIYKTASSAA